DWLPVQVDPAKLESGVDNSLPVAAVTISTGYWMDDLVWSPDASQIASGAEWRSEGGVVPFDLWQIDSGEKTAHFDEVAWAETIGWQEDTPFIISRDIGARDAEPRILAVSVDDSLKARLRFSAEQDIHWFDIVDVHGDSVVSLPDFVEDWRVSASFSPDGVYLAVSSASNSVKILDTRTGDVIAELPRIHSNAVAFSPDGLWLAVAQGTVIQIYSVADLLEG
ncbi:MAG: WD40 repeat domain-containing protein, partial [Chloroflexi bacterium]|nr:WD40 repeat domain-containing protein [Chloroflexota bacterium]